MATKIDNHLPSHPPYKLLGKNYQTPDLVAKVTGRAKYAEDYRADGMLFAKLLLSPVPHGHIRKIDASEALKMRCRWRRLCGDKPPGLPSRRPPVDQFE